MWITNYNRRYPWTTQPKTGGRWCRAANIHPIKKMRRDLKKTVINFTKSVDFLYTWFFLRVYGLEYWNQTGNVSIVSLGWFYTKCRISPFPGGRSLSSSGRLALGLFPSDLTSVLNPFHTRWKCSSSVE